MDEALGRFAPYAESDVPTFGGERTVWQARSIQPQRDADPQHVPVPNAWMVRLCYYCVCCVCCRSHRSRFKIISTQSTHVDIPGDKLVGRPTTLEHIPDPAGSRNRFAGVATPNTAGSGTPEHMGPPTIHVGVRGRRLGSFVTTAHVIGSAPVRTGVRRIRPRRRRSTSIGTLGGVTVECKLSISGEATLAEEIDRPSARTARWHLRCSET